MTSKMTLTEAQRLEAEQVCQATHKLHRLGFAVFGLHLTTPDGRKWRIETEVQETRFGYLLFELKPEGREAVGTGDLVATYEEEHDCPDDDLWTIGDLADYLEAVGAKKEADLVPASGACPNCGERHTDRLVWMNDEDEQVECQECFCIFSPTGKPNDEAPPLPTAVSAEGAD
jgi:hypothetical protein